MQVKIRMLKNGEHVIMIKLYVTSTDNILAGKRFLSIGLLYKNIDPVFESGPAGLGTMLQ